MAQAYWQSGQVGAATFSLFIRSYPTDRAYFVFAGLADVLEYLENFHFASSDLEYLRSLGRFDSAFIDYLGGLRFTGSVRALSEGSIFFTDEPVIEITGPVIEAQIVETFLINQINFQSLLATKASRVLHAARGREIIDFAARRTHGDEAANKLARISYMVGFSGTSNVLAGSLYGIPVSGTMAHSYIMTFPSEVGAFRHFAKSFPDSSIFLVDTYDTLGGTAKAIVVAREMASRGHHLRAIRLDSGDMLDLSKKTRALLDQAGLKEVQIFASGGLDEFEVDALVKAGAPIDGFGVGTKVGVSADAPWSDCAYKLVEYDTRPVLKLSTGKQSLPGPKQVFRFLAANGQYDHDILANATESCQGGEPLLVEVIRGGKRLRPDPTLGELRIDFQRNFACLPDRCKELRSPGAYPVRVSNHLKQLRDKVAEETRKREGVEPG